MTDVQIVKWLIDTGELSPKCLKDGKIIDGGFDFSVMELVKILRKFKSYASTSEKIKNW